MRHLKCQYLIHVRECGPTKFRQPKLISKTRLQQRALGSKQWRAKTAVEIIITNKIAGFKELRQT